METKQPSYTFRKIAIVFLIVVYAVFSYLFFTGKITNEDIMETKYPGVKIEK